MFNLIQMVARSYYSALLSYLFLQTSATTPKKHSSVSSTPVSSVASPQHQQTVASMISLPMSPLHMPLLMMAKQQQSSEEGKASELQL